ncbi:hypothetical protein KIL84_017152 [Mauremys mutica]|uniref:Uncharacterized protein n=1 Tax=Mauremys mutica TaxID=74926 RepID=A0A9D3X5R1_9SAUR|nr:hypothetical protein KIL84_017152 [Mauremys mutica]
MNKDATVIFRCESYLFDCCSFKVVHHFTITHPVLPLTSIPHFPITSIRNGNTFIRLIFLSFNISAPRINKTYPYRPSLQMLVFSTADSSQHRLRLKRVLSIHSHCLTQLSLSFF